MAEKDYATFVLRLGLGLFILIWGIAKFVQKDMWVQMFPMLYWGIAVGGGLLALFGIVELVIAVMLLLGLKVKIAAWIGFLIQLVTAFAIIGRIFSPFGMVDGDPVKPNIVLFATVPLLAAWLALALRGEAGACAIEK